MLTRASYKIENKLWKNGLGLVAGLDEAGRGSWAGPVVAAAVILPPKVKIFGLADSKMLSAKRREELFVVIKKKALRVGVGVVSHKVIDNYGILEATKRAFLRAINKLGIEPHYLLVDGIKIFNYHRPLEFIKQGDTKVVSIAAASIIAKVTRDQIMVNYHKKYPQYNFARHKGYGTKEHKRLLEIYGASEIHRTSFKPLIGY